MAPTSFILSIDPGLQGALALYGSGVSASFIWDMPLQKDGKLDPYELGAIVGSLSRRYPGLHAAIENVHSLPRQAGAFNFGLSTGIIHGVVAAHGVPFTLIAPSQWKPAMGLQRRTQDEPQSQTKARARQLATQLFPALADLFRRTKDDGRAEALLLAVYFANRK